MLIVAWGDASPPGPTLCGPPHSAGTPRNAPKRIYDARPRPAGSLGDGSQPPQTPAFPGRKQVFPAAREVRLLGGLPSQSAFLERWRIGPGATGFLSLRCLEIPGSQVFQCDRCNKQPILEDLGSVDLSRSCRHDHTTADRNDTCDAFA